MPSNKMTVRKIFQRFLVPPFAVSLYYLLKYRAKVSPRAEVELTSNLQLAEGVVIGSFCKFKATNSPIRVGKGTGFAVSCFVATGEQGISIGDYGIIGCNVCIVSSSYSFELCDVPYKKQPLTSKGVTIGNNVWIGSNVTIVDGARIGDNCIVGANSLINRKFPPNCIIQGNPAKIIMKREPVVNVVEKAVEKTVEKVRYQ